MPCWRPPHTRPPAQVVLAAYRACIRPPLPVIMRAMKPLFPAALLLSLALSACGSSDAPPVQPQAAPTAPANPASPPPPPPVTPAPTQWSGVVQGVFHEVFATLEGCTAAGYSALQCSRAQATAMAGLAMDPPRYASQADCQAQFKACSQWPSGTFAGLFSPRPIGFSMGGEPRGSAGPTPEHPSVYAAFFLDHRDQVVTAIVQPTGVQVLLLQRTSQPQG